MNLLLAVVGIILIIIALVSMGGGHSAVWELLIGIAILAFALGRNRKYLQQKAAQKQETIRSARGQQYTDENPYGPPVGPVMERRLWNVDSSFHGLTKTYYLAGVTFKSRTGHSRQQILSLIAEEVPPWNNLNLELNEFSYEGERAVTIAANGIDIGNIRRDDLAFFFSNAQNLIGVKSITSSDFLDDDGNRKFSCRLTLAYGDPPGASSSTDEFCPNCGTKLLPASLYCSHCGRPKAPFSSTGEHTQSAPSGDGFGPGSHWQHRTPN